MSIEQYIESTKYLQWEDGMYVMLDDLECDYELALVEDSLRSTRYFVLCRYFLSPHRQETLIGVNCGSAGLWHGKGSILLTREQALYIATGETTCTK
jgi:hypothetical protein